MRTRFLCAGSYLPIPEERQAVLNAWRPFSANYGHHSFVLIFYRVRTLPIQSCRFRFFNQQGRGIIGTSVWTAKGS